MKQDNTIKNLKILICLPWKLKQSRDITFLLVPNYLSPFFLFPLSVLAHFIPGLTWSITFFSFSLQRWRWWEEGESQAEWRQGCRSAWEWSQAQCGLFLIILMENCLPFPLKECRGYRVDQNAWVQVIRLASHKSPWGTESSHLLAWGCRSCSAVIRKMKNQHRATQALCAFSC